MPERGPATYPKILATFAHTNLSVCKTFQSIHNNHPKAFLYSLSTRSYQMPPLPQPKRPLAPAPKPTPTAAPKATFSKPDESTQSGFKLGIYGAEGSGKSSLAALCPGAIFADIEGSMKDIAVPKVPELNLNHPKFAGNWSLLRAWVQSLSNCVAGIDSITRAEDWAAQHVIKLKTSNDGLKAVDSLEDFKYKAGLTFVCDEFRKLLSDIDASRRRGVSWIMISHQRVVKFNNPDGSNYVRYEPRLVNDEKMSNMLQWVQFLDHLAFINIDVNVGKGGKATGGGSRAIYLDTSPVRICKARGIDNTTIVFDEGNTELWTRLGL